MQHQSRIYGPLISTADEEAHVRLFVDVYGLTLRERTRLGATETQELLGGEVAAGTTAELIVLQTPGVDAGVVLLALDPSSPETIRDWETRATPDALKVIDFYAPDFDAAIAHARSLGYDVREMPGTYALPEGTFREAHLWGPDNVVTAVLGGPAGFFADFAQQTDTRVSEVQSISAPVSSGADSIAFYRDVFGWDVVYEYAIDDPAFAALVGVDQLDLRSRNIGTSTREPYVGLIDYGEHLDRGTLRGRSRAPRRGLLGIVATTTDLDAVLTAATSAAGPVAAVSILGRSHAALVDTPHSVPHLVLGHTDNDTDDGLR